MKTLIIFGLAGSIGIVILGSIALHRQGLVVLKFREGMVLIQGNKD